MKGKCPKEPVSRMQSARGHESAVAEEKPAQRSAPTAAAAESSHVICRERETPKLRRQVERPKLYSMKRKAS